MARHAAYVHRLARGLLRSAGDAEDLAQETLLVSLCHTMREAGALRAFLRRVLRNGAHNKRRADVRRSRREQRASAPEAVESVDEFVARQEVLGRVTRAVEVLPEPYRTTVRLRYYEERSPAQIAETLGTPIATVKTRLRRALALLRGSLDESFGGERATWAGLLVPLTPSGVAPHRLEPKGLCSMPTSLQAFVVTVPVVAAASYFVPPTIAPPLRSPRIAVTAPSTRTTSVAGIANAVRKPQDPATRKVRVRVLDASGQPVPGAKLVWIQGKGGSAAHVRTDATGCYARSVADAQQVTVLCVDRRWDVTGKPATVIRSTGTSVAATVIHVRRVPTGKLVIRVRDLRTGTFVQDFSCSFNVPAKRSGWPGDPGTWIGSAFGDRTSSGVLEQHIPVAPGSATARVQIDLHKPSPARKRLTIQKGQVRDVELTIRSGPALRGRVVDAAGHPVADALVFAGEQDSGRSGGLLKAFRASRVKNGVRTKRDGSYAIRSDGARISVWHARFSGVTVARSKASLIRMPPRGGIRGRLIDRGGRPRAGVRILLDQQRATQTDRAGRFFFASVEAGIRGLHTPRLDGGTSANAASGGPWVVTVSPGHDARVEIVPGIANVVIHLRSGKLPWRSSGPAGLVGIGQSSASLRGKIEGDTLRVRDVPTGDYWFVASSGQVARCAIHGPTATLNLGTADLTVDAKPSQRLYLVPEGATVYLRSVLRRVSRLRVPASGRLRFGPIPVGDYEVCRGAERSGTPVHVQGPGTRLKL